MLCNLSAIPVILTWTGDAVEVVVTEGHRLPSAPLTADHTHPQASLEHYLSGIVTDLSRLHIQPLGLLTEPVSNQDYALEVMAPYLVLCPTDMLSKSVMLAPLDQMLDMASGNPEHILTDADRQLQQLVKSTTACLHLVPRLFSNLFIKQIFEYVLKGQVNRMTLRKRFENTGYIVATGQRIATGRGNRPQEMKVALDQLHDFGTAITVEMQE